MSSLNKIASKMQPEQAEEHFFALVKRLACGDWFTSRSSAAGLFAVLYPFVSKDNQAELRS